MHGTYFSLLPPLIALIFGFLTKQIIFGLLCGIVSAALIATDGSLKDAAYLVIEKVWKNSELSQLASWELFWQSSNLFLLLFLIALGIIVVLIGYSGGAYAYSAWIKAWINNKKVAQIASVLLSLFLSIDDYFSSLTVGSVMQPVTDQYKIPRVKLAFLVDSLAAPLALICPVSSWIAAIIGFLNDNGISSVVTSNTLIIADPFLTYLNVIPCIFYPFVVVVSIMYIILKPISFGVMRVHEVIAVRNGNLFADRVPLAGAIPEAPAFNIMSAHLRDFVYPSLALICITIASLLATGGYEAFGGHNSLVQAFQQANASKALFISGILSLSLITLYFLARKRVWLKRIPGLYWDGIQLMLPTIIMLICAWALGDIMRQELATGAYVSSLIPKAATSVLFMVPGIFLCALCIAFSMGSSFVTMAIMLPIAIPMLIAVSKLQVPLDPSELPYLYLILGALFSGAVAGNHISPLADTTVMSASSSGAYLIDHVYAQMLYALPIILGTAVGYLAAACSMGIGAGWACAIGLLVGCVTSIMVLRFFNKPIDSRRS